MGFCPAHRQTTPVPAELLLARPPSAQDLQQVEDIDDAADVEVAE